MAKPLSKSEIATSLAETAGLTKKQAVESLDALAVLAYRNAKNSFALPGLGKLVLVNRKARMGRNPATGESIKIAAKRVVKFRVTKAAKDAILGAKKQPAPMGIKEGFAPPLPLQRGQSSGSMSDSLSSHRRGPVRKIPFLLSYCAAAGRGHSIPSVKRTLVIAIAALLAVAPAHPQASGTATKLKTAELPSKQFALPPQQDIGETVGRGDPLVLRLRLSGRKEETEATFLVDTGSSVTILNRSFERLLGSRLGKQRLNRVFSGRGVEKANVYTAPRLCLGNVQLLTGPTVLTCKLAASGNNGPCEAILGMDCLTHYCVEADFGVRKLRFLDSDDLKRESYGRGFSIDCTKGVPVVSMKLLGERNVRFMLDSGFYQYADGTLPPEVIRAALQDHIVKDIGNGLFSFETVDIGAESYKTVQFAEMQIEDGGGLEGYIGLSFMARHVVTFDFPKGVLYLRSIRAQAKR
jgi:DNA-binding protein HU-beta